MKNWFSKKENRQRFLMIFTAVAAFSVVIVLAATTQLGNVFNPNGLRVNDESQDPVQQISVTGDGTDSQLGNEDKNATEQGDISDIKDSANQQDDNMQTSDATAPQTDLNPNDQEQLSLVTGDTNSQDDNAAAGAVIDTTGSQDNAIDVTPSGDGTPIVTPGDNPDGNTPVNPGEGESTTPGGDVIDPDPIVPIPDPNDPNNPNPDKPKDPYDDQFDTDRGLSDSTLVGLNVTGEINDGNILAYRQNWHDAALFQNVTVTAAYKKDGMVSNKVIPYGQYTVSMITTTSGSAWATISYGGLSGYLPYTVSSAGYELRYFSLSNGVPYFSTVFPGNGIASAYGLSSPTIDILYATSEGYVDGTVYLPQFIAYLQSETMHTASAIQGDEYRDVVTINTGSDGYLSTMFVGLSLSKPTPSDDGTAAAHGSYTPLLYLPPNTGSSSYFIGGVVEAVPDGYQIKGTVDGTFGKQILENYTGSDQTLDVPMGVTDVALQSTLSDITTIKLPSTIYQNTGLDTKELANKLPNLEAYEVAEDSKTFMSYGGALYTADGTTLLAVPTDMHSMENAWTDNVTTIADNAFYGNQMDSIIIPDTVTTYGNNCFRESDIHVLLPDSDYNTNIKEWMLNWYETNSSVILGAVDENGKEIADTVDLYTLKNRYIVLKTDNNAVAGVPDDVGNSFIMPENFTSVEAGAFANRPQISEITLSSAVTKLNKDSLAGAPQLTHLILDATNTAIDANAFGSSIPNDLVVTVPAASYDKYLTSWSNALDPVYGEGTAEKLLEADSGETFTENNARYQTLSDGSYRLLTVYSTVGTWIEIKDNTREISDEAFKNCSDLEIVWIPTSIELLGNHLFDSCTSLETVINLGSASLAPISGVDILSTDSPYSNYFISSDSGIIYGKSEKGWMLLNVPTDISSVSYRLDTYGFADRAFQNCNQIMTGMNFSKASNLTEIGAYAFEGCENIQSLTLPTNLAKVGEGAFYHMTGITAVDMRYTELTELPAKTFYGCTSLTSVYVNNTNITAVGDDCFYDCTALSGVTLPDSVTSIGDRAFMNCITLRYTGVNDAGTAENYLPRFVQTLGDRCFKNCLRLNEGSVILPESVTSIGSECFADCANLVSVTLNSKLTLIPKYTFSGCQSLSSFTTSVQQKQALTVIGAGAFENCSRLQMIDFTTYPNLQQIAPQAFSGCTSLIKVKLPQSITKLYSGCFTDCDSLSILSFYGSTPPALGDLIFGEAPSEYLNIWVNEDFLKTYVDTYTEQLDREYGEGTTANLFGVIDESLQVIRGITYRVDENGGWTLESVSKNFSGACMVADTTVAIADEAFLNCKGLTSITLPADTSITLGDRVFIGCDSLAEVHLMGSIPSWGSDTFRDCTAIQTLEIGRDPDCFVAEIGTRAFSGCTGLSGTNTIAGITLRSTVEKIGAYAFAGCKNLVSFACTAGHRAGVQEVGEHAFDGCSSIINGGYVTSAFSSLETIGDYAFRNCDSLSSGVVPANVTYLGDGCFMDCDNVLAVSFYGKEKTRTTIPKDCFKNCPNLTKTNGQSMLNYITTIESGAYENCTSLNMTAWTSFASLTSLETIEADAFNGCSSITSMTLPASLTSLGAGALNGTGIETLTFQSTAAPHIGSLSLSSLPNAFCIRVPDSEGYTVFTDYLNELLNQFSEDTILGILDSVSDGANEQYVAANKPKNPEEKSEEEKPDIKTPEEEEPSEEVPDDADDDKTDTDDEADKPDSEEEEKPASDSDESEEDEKPASDEKPADAAESDAVKPEASEQSEQSEQSEKPTESPKTAEDTDKSEDTEP